MPTIIPGYVYSLFAALIVGVIVVYSCSIATLSIKADADAQQLKNIEQYVAAESLTLISHTTEESQNSTRYLDIPSQIGNQRFWIQLTNDSSTAWVTAGLGVIILSNDTHEVLPAKVEASGGFISGSGRAVLQCQFEDGFVALTLTKSDN
jgi:hypothetical protein